MGGGGLLHDWLDGGKEKEPGRKDSTATGGTANRVSLLWNGGGSDGSAPKKKKVTRDRRGAKGRNRKRRKEKGEGGP